MSNVKALSSNTHMTKKVSHCDVSKMFIIDTLKSPEYIMYMKIKQNKYDTSLILTYL